MNMQDDYHVYPINDLREHELSKTCWCKPTYDEDGFYIHHSIDRREEYETGARSLN